MYTTNILLHGELLDEVTEHFKNCKLYFSSFDKIDNRCSKAVKWVAEYTVLQDFIA